jgi:hypothetical protein
MPLDYGKSMRDEAAIPHWPRWYCSRILQHWGYLREVRKIDDTTSEYVCRACGWQGQRRRPSKKLRLYGF